jgi:hypothetical protein
MQRVFRSFIAVTLTLISVNSFAVVETVSSAKLEPSHRMQKRAGAYLGILGDPFPTLIGVNLGYNVFDFLRATAGIGQVSASTGASTASATTLGAGARFLVPGWSLSPSAGLSVAYLAYASDGLGISLGNYGAGGLHAYASFGVDWQTEGGFNLGLGYNVSFRSGFGGMPYINLGWFSDFI